MLKTMLNKSFRKTREDAAGLQKLVKGDTRVEKSQGEALYYAFKDAAENTPDWKEIKKLKFDDSDEELEFGNTMSFTVEEGDFNAVVESLREQLGIDRVRISYMTRLVILAARAKLDGKITDKKETEEKKVEFEVVVNDEPDNRFARMQAYMTLLTKSDAASLEKLAKIDEILKN